MTDAGFFDYAESLLYSGECLGQSGGDKQAADLGDGNGRSAFYFSLLSPFSSLLTLLAPLPLFRLPSQPLPLLLILFSDLPDLPFLRSSFPPSVNLPPLSPSTDTLAPFLQSTKPPSSATTTTTPPSVPATRPCASHPPLHLLYPLSDASSKTDQRRISLPSLATERHPRQLGSVVPRGEC